MSSTAHESSVFDAHGFTFQIASPIADVIALFDDVLVDMVVGGGIHPVDNGVVEQVAVTSVHRFDIRLADSPNDTESDLLAVSLDDQAVYPRLRSGNLTSHLLMEVNRRATRSSTHAGFVPMHAAAASSEHRTLLLPGASHSGKTTLATALAAKYGDRVWFVADEVSVLDPADLSIARYGKPVALRTSSVELLADAVPILRTPPSRYQQDERFVPPSALGVSQRDQAEQHGQTQHHLQTDHSVRRPAGAKPIGAVVFPRFADAGESRPVFDRALVPLTPGATLERMMQSVLGVGAISADTFNELARVAASASGYELRYAHLDDVIGELAQLL